ncbi:MAG: hypothetical protein AAGF11_40175 [Myxococcota bacterium]
MIGCVSSGLGPRHGSFGFGLGLVVFAITACGDPGSGDEAPGSSSGDPTTSEDTSGSGSGDETSGSGDETSGSGDETATGGEPDIEALYQAAVDDAEVVDADEIVDDLVAIELDNPVLTFDDQGRVLMVTWTSWDGYDEEIGMDTTLGVEVWMTPAPQLQQFCQGTGLIGDALDLRMEQVLGVPPNDGKDRVVQLWVPPDALFRPTPDAEIDDTVAELDFPASATPEHIEWVETLRTMSYGEGGYPWTQLGYTYDWNPDSPEVGLSEFVAYSGSAVGVESVTPQTEYCQ